MVFQGVRVARAGRPVLHDIDARLPAGTVMAVMGANGAGKSTLLAAAAGRLPLAAGRIGWSDGASRRVAWLPQAARLDVDVPVTVGDLVLSGHPSLQHPLREAGSGARLRAAQALARVGLSDHAGRLVGALSPGERQRALFARALVADAPLVVLDEPFAATDRAATADLLACIARWRTEGVTVLVALHDPDLAAACAQVVLTLAHGRLVETAEPGEPWAVHGARAGLEAGSRPAGITVTGASA